MNRISNPSVTKEIMNRYGFNLKKKFGQNFLIDQHILDSIISGAELSKNDVVIEIGPGIGSLTQNIAENVFKVIAVEIDKTLIPILNEVLQDYDNIEIINKDILKVDLDEIISPYINDYNIKIVANLPYYITTPIIMKVFEDKIDVDSMTVMVQKEVADRMKGQPSTKDYGALSIAVQYYSEPNVIVQVPPSCFIPQPKVGSSVIHLQSKKLDDNGFNDKLMFKLIRGAFQQRRKTMVNALSNSSELHYDKEDIKNALEALGMSLTIRGEALSLEDYMALTNKLEM